MPRADISVDVTIYGTSFVSFFLAFFVEAHAMRILPDRIIFQLATLLVRWGLWCRIGGKWERLAPRFSIQSAQAFAQP